MKIPNGNSNDKIRPLEIGLAFGIIFGYWISIYLYCPSFSVFKITILGIGLSFPACYFFFKFLGLKKTGGLAIPISMEKPGIQKDLNAESEKKQDLSINIYSEIVEHANVSIVVTNANGEIEWVNPGFTKQTQYYQEEAIGKKPGSFLQGPQTKKADIEKFRKGLKGLEPFNIEILNYGKDGTAYTIEAIVSPIIGKDGNVERFISIQKDISEVKRKSEELAKNYEDKNASIRYAKKIQDSVLDILNKFDKHFINSFVYFAPKDILSGDFFAVRESNESLFIICGDCEGHGVPAAFLSLIVLNALDSEIVSQRNTPPGQMLSNIYKKVNLILNNDTRLDIYDSFEISIIRIERPKEIQKNIAISTCGIKILAIKDGAEIKIEHGKGGLVAMKDETRIFKESEFQTDGNTSIYLWTDGFTDQVGGIMKKKYLRKTFQKFLSQISLLPIADQEMTIKTEFENWKGEEPQYDDVTVIGFRL